MKQITKDQLDNYVLRGCEPNGFVLAVLANDLLGAVGKADRENLRDLHEICIYVYASIPAACHGSYLTVSQWMDKRQKHEEKEHKKLTTQI